MPRPEATKLEIESRKEEEDENSRCHARIILYVSATGANPFLAITVPSLITGRVLKDVYWRQALGRDNRADRTFSLLSTSGVNIGLAALLYRLVASRTECFRPAALGEWEPRALADAAWIAI